MTNCNNLKNYIVFENQLIVPVILEKNVFDY